MYTKLIIFGHYFCSQCAKATSQLLINRELLTKRVHGLDGFRRLHIFAATVLVLSSDSE